jgi:hypothetical protein
MSLQEGSFALVSEWNSFGNDYDIQNPLRYISEPFKGYPDGPGTLSEATQIRFTYVQRVP